MGRSAQQSVEALFGLEQTGSEQERRDRLALLNARLAAIVQSSADAIIGKTLEGVVESWNEGAVRMYGYSPKEAVGRHISFLAPPDRKAEITALLDRPARGERIEGFETVRVTKDGSPLLVSLTISPTRGPDGGIVGASTVARDISEQKRAERALRESEARTKAIVEASLDAIVTMGADGRIREFNAAAERIFGWSRAQAIGEPLAELLVPERLRQRHRRGFARHLATGEGEILGRRIEMPALRADGTEIPVELTVVRADLEDPGEPLFVAALRDMSEQKQAEHENGRLAAIVQSSGDAIIGKSLEGVIESWNDGATRIYGYTAEEAIGRHISILAPPERRNELAGLLERVKRGERIEHFETRRVAKDGHAIDISLSLSPIHARDGAIVGASIIARDITEQKRAVREQHEFELSLLETQKLESLGVLAGGIAHDFNNLLVGVLGNASLALAQLPSDTPVRATLEQIELAGQRTAELTRQMLAYSGKGTYVVQPVHLPQVVREMADLIESTISKKARLSFSFAKDTPLVEADVTQLRQVVLNLITNASESLGDRGGTITITTGSLAADRAYLSNYELADELAEGRYAYLAVEDTGAGMDDETKTKIFDPFFTTKFTGRGLGLAAVLGIVRSHRGAIKVYSEPGHGTAFKLLFPVAAAGEARVPAPVDSEDWRGSGTVLVADDEETVRAVASTMLELLGFSVVLAEDGHQALDIVQERRGELSLVLLDLMMPGMDGAEVIAELERLGMRLPIILTSGYNAQDLSQRFVGRRIAAFLQKPYRFPELAAMVRSVIEARAR